jgi:hypothetical protein
MRSISSTHSSPMTLIIRTSPSSACDFVQSGDRDAIPNQWWRVKPEAAAHKQQVLRPHEC